MFFNSPPRQVGTLRVSDNFATLKKITSSESRGGLTSPSSQDVNDELHYIFTYEISQFKALEENALSVEITVKTRNKNRPVLIDDFQSKREIAAKVITHRTSIANADAGSIICKVQSNFESSMNKQVIQAIKNNSEIENLGIKKNKMMLRTIKYVKENGLIDKVIKPTSGFYDSKYRLSLNGNESIDTRYYRSSIRTLLKDLMDQEIAPSEITSQNDRTNSSFENYQGIFKTSKKQFRDVDLAEDVLSLYLYESQENPKKLEDRPEEEFVTTIEQINDGLMTIRDIVKLPTSLIKENSQLIIKFDLLKSEVLSSGENSISVLESVEKTLDIGKTIESYQQVKKPPIVGKFRDQSTIILSIQQVDEKADYVEIYKKTINGSKYTNYTKIDEFALSKKDGSLSRRYDNLQDQHTIFRVIAKSSLDRKIKSNEFTDVIVTNKKIPSRHLTLVPILVPGGIQITAYNRNPEIKSALILARNVTLKHNQFIPIGRIYFSENETEQTIVFSNLKHDHIYEFTSNIIDAKGNEYVSSYTTFIEFMEYEGKALKVVIDNAGGSPQNRNNSIVGSATTSNGDYSFSCRAILQKDAIGQMQSALGSTSALYNTLQLLESEASYDKLIFFMITRYNVNNGEIANLGIVESGELMIDSVQSEKFLAETLQPNNEYVYVIQPLIRDPEPAITTNKEMVDKITKKKYTMNPKQHRHPVLLKYGNIFPLDYIKFDRKHPALYGKVGVNYVLKIAKKSTAAEILALSADLDGDKCLVSWRVGGEISKIDHFVVMTVNENFRRVVGKAHCVETNVVKFIHELTQKDVGYNHYVIIPVYSNLEVGTPLKTNKILVKETDVMVN